MAARDASSRGQSPACAGPMFGNRASHFGVTYAPGRLSTHLLDCAGVRPRDHRRPTNTSLALHLSLRPPETRFAGAGRPPKRRTSCIAAADKPSAARSSPERSWRVHFWMAYSNVVPGDFITDLAPEDMERAVKCLLWNWGASSHKQERPDHSPIANTTLPRHNTEGVRPEWHKPVPGAPGTSPARNRALPHG